MKALILRSYDGLDGLALDTVPEPTAKPGQVVVRVHAVSVNRLDLIVMSGKKIPGHQTLPHVLGSDPAGEIEAIGENVEGFRVGDRVVIKPNVACFACDLCERGLEDSCLDQTIVGVDLPGGSAELVAAPARNVFRVPASVTDEQATALAHSFPIALQMLRERAHMTDHDTVLVTGAAGAVGSAAVQLASDAGARVIAAVSTEDKARAALDNGADEIVIYAPGSDVTGVLRDLTYGNGITLAVDTAGDPDVLQQILDALGHRGRLVICGAHGGSELRIDPMRLYRSRIEIMGSASPSYQAFEDCLSMAETGRIRPLIHGVLPWQHYEKAYRLLTERRNHGKVVLRVS